MNKNDYKSIKPAYKDPIMNITEEEYYNYLNEYLSSSKINNNNANLQALLAAIVGFNNTYKEDYEKDNVKSLGARK